MIQGNDPSAEEKIRLLEARIEEKRAAYLEALDGDGKFEELTVLFRELKELENNLDALRGDGTATGQS